MRFDRVGDSFKLLLKEAFARQMNDMIDNFTQILGRLQKSNSSSSSGRVQDTRYIKYTEQKRNARNNRITVEYPA
jgi:hypothetical protein